MSCSAVGHEVSVHEATVAAQVPSHTQHRQQRVTGWLVGKSVMGGSGEAAACVSNRSKQLSP